MLYDLINMSDPYTFRSDDLEIAALTTILLGRGQYGARPIEDGGENIPIFMFGGPDEWFEERFQRKTEPSLVHTLQTPDRQALLVACLRSVVIGRPEERATFDAAYDGLPSDQREEWRAKRHEERRSSLNDIGGRALQMAKIIEETGDIRGAPKAPQQVF